MLPFPHQFLARGAASWIPMDRSLLIRNRELESNDIFVCRVDVFFGGLEAEDCPFKDESRCGLLLGPACFSFLHWCSAYILRLCFVVPFFPTFVRLVHKPIINNNIFTVKKNMRSK
jgi:hypothetical protein